MAKVKYSVREYTPTGNMPGVHGFYAEARPDNVISNVEIAKKVENRGISRAVVIPAAAVTGEWWLLGVPFCSTTIGRLLSQ